MQTLKSDSSRRTYGSVRLEFKNVAELGEFASLECFVGVRENFVLNVLITFVASLRTGEIRKNLGVPETAQAGKLRINCRQ